MSAKKYFSIYFFIACITLIVFAEFREHTALSSEADIAAQAQENLQKLEKQMQISLDEILKLQAEKDLHEYFIHHGVQNSGFSFFYYENEKLTKWSDNEADITVSLSDSIQNPLLLHLANGWYEVFSRQSGTKKVIGLLLIKKE